MKKFILSSIIASLLIIIAISLYLVLGRMNRVEMDKSDEALGIIAEIETENKIEIKKDVEKVIATTRERNDILNIALFGLDRNKPGENSRSDSMIILTVDFKNKKIKLSSLMRDMYVNIEGYGKTKLNHAYSYGGAALALKTINQNLGTNIRDYISADFLTLEKIVDLLGGVNINIKQEEIIELNKMSKDINITKSGKQSLSGNQAVAYSRIRYTGNGDFERTERQRRVLYEVFKKAKDAEIISLTNLALQILPLVETSMESKLILDMISDYFKAGEMAFEQERFPIDGYYWSDMIDRIYYLKYDTEATKQQVIDYLYNDVKPIPGQ